jgi:hypothetical protein
MGQPPQWGHFTSRVSVSIIVAAPKSWAPMDRQRSGIADGSCSIRTPCIALPFLRFRVFVLALRGAGSFAPGGCQSPMIRWHVWRVPPLTLARSRRFALFAVALLTVKRNDRPMTIRVKVEDIGRSSRDSRSGSSRGPAFLARFSLSLQRVCLAAVGLRQVREAFGSFGIARGSRHPLGLVGLLPEELGFLHHRPSLIQTTTYYGNRIATPASMTGINVSPHPQQPARVVPAPA